MDSVKFETLVGKTLAKAEGKVGSDEVVFVTDSGEEFKLYHYQNCCERVAVEDICGDLSDLVGSPILLAEEAVSSEDPPDYIAEDRYDDSFTWTFYKLSTVKGSVTIRWLGESNGYYSEDVDFVKMEQDN